METAALRWRVLRKAAWSPMVLVPVLFGAWALATGVLMGSPAGFFGFLGVTGVALGLGLAAARFVLGGERYAQDALREAQEARYAAGETKLNQVERRLEKTRDTRTFQDIRMLRALRRRLLGAVETGAFAVPPEVVSMSEQMYRSCVESLEHSAVLWETARKMATQAARDELMAKREALLQEVSRSVYQLAQTVDALQAAPLQRDTGQELGRIRQELDTNLQVARRVEARMQALERELGGRSRGEVLDA